MTGHLKYGEGAASWTKASAKGAGRFPQLPDLAPHGMAVGNSCIPTAVPLSECRNTTAAKGATAVAVSRSRCNKPGHDRKTPPPNTHTRHAYQA